MILHDQKIQIPIAIYVKNIMKIYREETEGTTQIIKSPVKTRSGRHIKKPTKLNL